MTSEPTFSEDDFQIDELDKSTDAPAPAEADTARTVDAATGGSRKRNLAITVGPSAVVLAVVGGGFWAFQSDSDAPPMLSESSMRPLSEPAPVIAAPMSSPRLADRGSEDFSVSYGDQGVEINEVESKIADTLLKSRPTHIEVDQLVDEKLEKLFENPDRLAALRALNAEDRQAIQRDIAVLGENIAALRAGLTDLKSVTKELKASQQKVADRQTRLEEAFARAKRESKPEVAKRVTLEPRLPWEVTAMSSSVAILRNTSTGEKLRVAVGHSISGCGQVKDFDVSKDLVRTTSGCVIQRRQG